MKKLKIPMMLLFLMGFLIIGACEKVEDPDPIFDQTLEISQDSALEDDQYRENREDADKVEEESDPSL